MDFSSIDQLQAGVSAVWNAEITQAQAGALDASFWVTQIDACQVFSGIVNLPLVCTGRRFENYWTLTPISRHSAGGRFRGQQLRDGDLLLLNPGGEVFLQTPANHTQTGISIPVDLAARIIRAEHHGDPASLLGQWARKSEPVLTARLESLLCRLHACPALPGRSAGEAALDFAGQVIAIAQSGAAASFLRSSLANRRRIVATAEELIRSRLHKPPSVTELCEATHASRRLLFYAFGELLGRSPAVHIKLLRLHAARRVLVAAGPKAPIQQIAAALGFGHLGQFSIDYLRSFGERPSQTRRYSRSSGFGRANRRPR